MTVVQGMQRAQEEDQPVKGQDLPVHTETKPKEVEDSDDEEEYTDTASRDSCKISEKNDSSEETDNLVYKIAWESRRGDVGRFDPQGFERDVVVQRDEFAVPLESKKKGNEFFSSGKWTEACREYLKGIQYLDDFLQEADRRTHGTNEISKTTNKGDDMSADTRVQATNLLGILHSNSSAAYLKLDRKQQAIRSAKKATVHCPKWPKAYYRLAEAYMISEDFQLAMATCLQGEKFCSKDSDGRTLEFSPMIDSIAVRAAISGNLTVGFPGRQLEVRCAGEEAWLGRPAPHVPELDGPLDEDSALPSDSLDGENDSKTSKDDARKRIKGGTSSHDIDKLQKGMDAGASISAREDALVSWTFTDNAALQKRQRTSFRSLNEAMKAAIDGDRIILRRGVHNGLGEAVNITKRVLIEGEGSLGETVIDQRANVPTFRISKGGGGAVIRNIDIDQSGFRESILITGDHSISPLIDSCIVKCSGDDTVNISDSARVYLLRCEFTGKTCGIKAFGSSIATVHGCKFKNCGEQSIKAAENAQVIAIQCSMQDSTEDAIVAMGNSKIRLAFCHISGAKGPGVDVSDKASVAIQGTVIKNCVGGVWLWDNGHAVIQKSKLDGGPSQVILVDGDATVTAKSSTIKGTVHATDEAWKGLLNDENIFEDPDNPTDFPLETGPFVWNPPRYTSI